MNSKIKDQIDHNLKQAMLGGRKNEVSTLREIKSAILYEEVAKKLRDKGGLNDDQVLGVLTKESKKRQESADLFEQAGETGRRNQELEEKSIIDSYLPAKLSDEDILEVINSVIIETGDDKQQLGRIIAETKARASGAADGAQIARLTKERLGM